MAAKKLLYIRYEEKQPDGRKNRLKHALPTQTDAYFLLKKKKRNKSSPLPPPKENFSFSKKQRSRGTFDCPSSLSTILSKCKIKSSGIHCKHSGAREFFLGDPPEDKLIQKETNNFYRLYRRNIFSKTYDYKIWKTIYSMSLRHIKNMYAFFSFSVEKELHLEFSALVYTRPKNILAFFNKKTCAFLFKYMGMQFKYMPMKLERHRHETKNG